MARRSIEPAAVAVPDVITPTYSLDGWTLESTRLRGRLPEEVEGELATLLHYVRIGVRTPWTYERAAEVLESAREPAQALAICERYFALFGASTPPDRAAVRTLERRRNRLRAALAPAPSGSAAPSPSPSPSPSSSG